MLTSLRLQGFKNFRDAAVALGPLTLLVGTNAAGKSNLRDAFRFLHGGGRGYSLALRFLAMIAALLGPESSRCYFFEELDNGIHPARLHLLLSLIERQAERGKVQRPKARPPGS